MTDPALEHDQARLEKLLKQVAYGKFTTHKNGKAIQVTLDAEEVDFLITLALRALGVSPDEATR